MVIAISGKIGAGKDTVGSIIQYLTSRHLGTNTLKGTDKLEEHLTFKDFNKGFRTPRTINSKWEIKKFAYKLKQIVSLLTGISVEDLEKQEVKDQVLGEEWNSIYKHNNWIWKHGFEGYQNKDETLDQYVDRNIKNGNIEVQAIDGIDIIYRWTFLDKKEQKTVRWLLQTLGTEAMRNCIHEDIWINALFSDYKSKEWEDQGVYHESKYIITDMRFPNELKAVEDRKGITIRVNRPNNLQMMLVDMQNNTSKIIQHPSENSLDHSKFDYIIDNNGTIEDLVERVKEILIKEDII